MSDLSRRLGLLFRLALMRFPLMRKRINCLIYRLVLRKRSEFFPPLDVHFLELSPRRERHSQVKRFLRGSLSVFPHGQSTGIRKYGEKMLRYSALNGGLKAMPLNMIDISSPYFPAVGLPSDDSSRLGLELVLGGILR